MGLLIRPREQWEAGSYWVVYTLKDGHGATSRHVLKIEVVKKQELVLVS